jgi:hypothetical protein
MARIDRAELPDINILREEVIWYRQYATDGEKKPKAGLILQ